MDWQGRSDIPLLTLQKNHGGVHSSGSNDARTASGGGWTGGGGCGGTFPLTPKAGDAFCPG